MMEKRKDRSDCCVINIASGLDDRFSRVDNQKFHDTTHTTDAVFKWGVGKTADFVKLCPQYKLNGKRNFTDGMKRFVPVFMTLVPPFLRKRNDRMDRFAQC